MINNRNINYSSREDLLFVYNKSNDIKINPSDLELELINFKRAVQNEVNLPTIVTLISIYIPFFTSDFKDFFILTSRQTLIAYSILVVIITMFIAKTVIISLFKLVLKIKYFNKIFIEYSHNNESDPNKKTKLIIKNKCN